jgi:AsmA family protein
VTLAPEPVSATAKRYHRWRWAGGVVLGVCAAIAMLVLVWDWNWLRTMVEVRASAGIGRMVTMERLEVHPGRSTVIVAYGLRVANPAGFEGPDFATFPKLSVTFDAMTWLRTGRLVLPMVEADQPVFNVLLAANGQNNWTLAPPASTASTDPNPPPAVEVGDMVINGGTSHVVAPAANTNMTMSIATGGNADKRTLMMDAKGIYANQPITARAIGGALLSIRDDAPYPVNLTLTNGGTHITLKGTVRDPLALTGADLNLTLAGPDMALLFPLTGIPIPKTPPYHVTGKLDFGDRRIKFTNMKGQVGSSDLNGAVELDPHGTRLVLTGTLSSHQVDLQDLGGFIGSQPGRTTTPGQTAQQVQDVQRAVASPKLLPTTPISLPRVRAADIHITYRGDRILGKDMPFDSLSVKLDIDDGRIRLSPLRLGVGVGTLSGMIDLKPMGDELDTDASVKLEHVNIATLLATWGLGSGHGPIDGTASLKGRGASLSAIVGHGNGAMHVVMPQGGDVNALLIDLSGIELGRAFLAAINLPN